MHAKDANALGLSQHQIITPFTGTAAHVKSSTKFSGHMILCWDNELQTNMLLYFWLLNVAVWSALCLYRISSVCCSGIQIWVEHLHLFGVFYIDFNTVQVISRWVVGTAEETST